MSHPGFIADFSASETLSPERGTRGSPCYLRSMPSPRRFPPPWTLDEHNDACFILKDATRQALAYVSFEDEPGRRSAAKLLTRDEARRLAVNFAKPPELLRRKG